MLTQDGRRTPHDERRRPILIGHPSDPGDLKTSKTIDLIDFCDLNFIIESIYNFFVSFMHLFLDMSILCNILVGTCRMLPTSMSIQ